eukprot:gene218-234_t
MEDLSVLGGVTVGVEFPASNGFKEVYYRSSSRANGQRNIRCFPTCSPQHNDKNFCGRPVTVVVHLYIEKTLAGSISLDSICCVGEYKPQEASYCISEPIAGEALQQIVRPKPSNQRSTYWGRLVESFPGKEMGELVYLRGLFEFNTELRGWSYAWPGARFRGSARHVFAVTVCLLRRNSSVKPHKPLWPFTLGLDFRSDQFFPVGYFDSPSFTFGSFRERQEIVGNSLSESNSRIRYYPCIELPRGYNPEDDPQQLDMPQGVLTDLLDPQAVLRYFSLPLQADVIQSDLRVEDILKAIVEGLPSKSILSDLINEVPDLCACTSYFRLKDIARLSPAARCEQLAIHDYFFRFQMLCETFEADPVKRQLKELGGQRLPVPFPYRPSSSDLLNSISSLLLNEKQEPLRLLQDLLKLTLVFPVAVEPAIFFILSLQAPLSIDPHCFSTAPTLQPAGLSMLSNSRSLLGQSISMKRPPSLPSLAELSQGSLFVPPAVPNDVTATQSCGSGLFEPLLSLNALISEPNSNGVPAIMGRATGAPTTTSSRAAPPTPPSFSRNDAEGSPQSVSTVRDEVLPGCGSMEGMCLFPSLSEPVQTTLEKNLAVPMPTNAQLQQARQESADGSSGAWRLLRLIAEYYCAGQSGADLMESDGVSLVPLSTTPTCSGGSMRDDTSLSEQPSKRSRF